MYGIKQTGFSLEEYWQYVQVSLGAGFGIAGCPDADVITAPSALWEQRERVWFADAIAMVEGRLVNDRWLGFPIRRSYYGARQMPYTYPFYLGKYLRGIGVQKEANILLAAPITLRTMGVINDPIVLTTVVTFTDPDELVLYYPGDTKYRIRPSDVKIVAGVATITIPRVSLLKPAYFINFDTTLTQRPVYDDDIYFLTTVDIVRNYLDTSTGFNLVWLPDSNDCTQTVTKQLAAAEIRDQRNGIAFSTTPTISYAVCGKRPDYIEVAYMKGRYDRYDEIDSELTRAIVGIVHNYVPEEPCRQMLEGRLFFLHDIRALEPAINTRLGPSTWGIFEAIGIISSFDHDLNSHYGGML